MEYDDKNQLGGQLSPDKNASWRSLYLKNSRHKFQANICNVLEMKTSVWTAVLPEVDLDEVS